MSKRPDLLLVTDYRGAFWSSIRNLETMTTMDVGVLERALVERGVKAEVTAAGAVDLRRDWYGVPVVYTSSEDAGLLYKSFLEDLLAALTVGGARLIPPLPLLRAHHNKVFMEMLRTLWLPEDPMVGGTFVVGTFEEFEASNASTLLPAVVKEAAGAGSATVEMATTAEELRTAAERASLSDSRRERTRLRAKAFAHRRYRPISSHRQKFVVQKLLPGLDGDFKVLRYGARYFALFRQNRPNDFRASGGGRLDFVIENHCEPRVLLEYAASVAERIPSPFQSLDIAFSDGEPYLLEFQAVCFGPATLERSTRHWEHTDSGFVQRDGVVVLEEVFAEALCQTIEAQRG